ncbi:hypothetical protein Pcinc_032838 [Petrolisthes cinctipes]|uniref:Alkyl transferase n=1 Tax=Petrolisthes cinctipes TaxID=88211 RepID=A0AAE1ETT4_PETCI|nr:hypothetical protein Pcinc_032838 [Petrolisthes cinctipes]
MTWIVEKKRSWAEWVALRTLLVGPIPTHLAVIMDGNRRYARQKHQDTLTGHTQGFHKLAEMLGWCRDLGINQVTAYAFSIENFKRSKQEVDGLMELAAEKFEVLLEEQEKLDKHGVCIRVVGNLSLLPQRTRQMAARAVIATQQNNNCYLNLALAYTSRQEMTQAMNELVDGVQRGELLASDISEELMEECLYTRGSKDPDLLLRTSGEVRLSDFLLWQSGFSCLYFTQALWPELTIWHLFGAVFYYQRHHHMLVAARQLCLDQRECVVEEQDVECCRIKYGDKLTQEHITEYARGRENRIAAFLASLTQRRLSYLQQLACGDED